MSNIRLQSIVSNKVEALVKELSCKPHIGFIRLLLAAIFELDETSIEDAITDGFFDKGIDAIFELENEDGENVLYVIQSKYFQNHAKALSEDDKNKTKETVVNYILSDYPLENLHIDLQKKISHYRLSLASGNIHKIGLIFITNGQRPSAGIFSELDKFQKDNPTIFYEIYTESELSKIFEPVSARGIKEIDLKIIKDAGAGDRPMLNLPDIDIAQGKVCKVDVVEVARLTEENPAIFNSNVRAFLSTNKNGVNEKISLTLKDPARIKEFVYLNNGITILCDDIAFMAGNEVLKIKNPSIINGCQTASTILEVYKAGQLDPNLGFVLVRIIKSIDPEVKMRIILASNTQTTVKPRDLRSEDRVQKELEEEFATLDYYYERKPRMHIGKPDSKIIDMEKAAQAYMSLILKMPAEAKNKKAEIYKTHYDQIFNKEISAKQLLVPLLFSRSIANAIALFRKKSKDKEYRSLLGNAAFHFLPLFDEWVLKPKNISLSSLESDLDRIELLVSENMEQIVARLKKVIKKINPENLQYFFKASDSLVKILGTPGGEPKYTLTLDKETFKKQKDLRYYKPDEYSLGAKPFNKIKHWNDLFVKLMNLYMQGKNVKSDGELTFLNAGNKQLLANDPPDEEKILRKKLDNGAWVFTNFDSKTLSNFCFKIAEKLDLSLLIKLRPTRFRLQKKYKD